MILWNKEGYLTFLGWNPLGKIHTVIVRLSWELGKFSSPLNILSRKWKHPLHLSRTENWKISTKTVLFLVKKDLQNTGNLLKHHFLSQYSSLRFLLLIMKYSQIFKNWKIFIYIHLCTEKADRVSLTSQSF